MLPGSEHPSDLRLYTLPMEGNLFEELLASVRFEDVGKGRQGAVLVHNDEAGRIPLVRTTTKYTLPAQPFQAVHRQVAEQIQTMAALPVGFNNALIENYTDAYTTMGSHSDQALDLAEGTFIALFSCYKHPENAIPPRKLFIEEKGSSGKPSVIPLTPGSVLVFSLDANRRFKHKIVLDAPPKKPGNLWLGITFRTSKTFVHLRDEGAYFSDGTRLTLANDGERREFYHLRRRENEETDFTSPPISYTLSESDLMPPRSFEGPQPNLAG